MNKLIALFSLSLFSLNVPAQNAGYVDAPVPPPPDSLFASLYACISGAAGEARDWATFRRLMHPQARLTPISLKAGDTAIATVLDAEGFIAAATKNTQNTGFYEHEISRRCEQFYHLCHAWSTYQARIIDGDGTEHTLRGINSLQLMHNGKEWKILAITWQPATGEMRIPKKYLKPLKKKKGMSF